MEKSNNNSFFDFDEKDKHIIVSENELFDIIDKAENFNNKNIEQESNNTFIDDNSDFKENTKDKYKNIIEEEINTIPNKDNSNLNSEKIIIDDVDSDEVVEININELYEYYEKQKKIQYFIKEGNSETNQNKSQIEDSQRNLLLDKLTEVKTKDIIEDEEKDIISDDMQILENEEIDDNKNLIDESLYNVKDLEEIKNSELKDKDKNISINDKYLKTEIKDILNYIDNLLDALPEEKIEEFANSKYFSLYKKILKELQNEK